MRRKCIFGAEDDSAYRVRCCRRALRSRGGICGEETHGHGGCAFFKLQRVLYVGERMRMGSGKGNALIIRIMGEIGVLSG